MDQNLLYILILSLGFFPLVFMIGPQGDLGQGDDWWRWALALLDCRALCRVPAEPGNPSRFLEPLIEGRCQTRRLLDFEVHLPVLRRLTEALGPSFSFLTPSFASHPAVGRTRWCVLLL